MKSDNYKTASVDNGNNKNSKILKDQILSYTGKKEDFLDTDKKPRAFKGHMLDCSYE